MNEYIQYLSELIPDKDSLKLVKTEAEKFYKTHTSEECYMMYPLLYRSDNFQIQEIGVFLAGYIADEYPDALEFLHDTVSRHESWKVQEILAMAFDNHCAKIGYENALPLIRDWFADANANIRRAASEGLRIWTSRPYFKENPQAAIAMLASHKDDESEYVRKSAGNSLRDISKKFPDLVAAELHTWDLSSKRTMQVFKLAGKFLEKKAEEQAEKLLGEYFVPNMDLAERFAFRSICQEEADQAAVVEQICFPPNEACSEKHMKERIAKAPELFLVAVDKQTGKMAGFLNGLATNEDSFRDEFFTDAELYVPDGKNVMLLGLDVLPEYRMRGLGRELVYRYLRRESAKNRSRVILTCLDEKVNMYKKMGFRDDGISGSTWGGEKWHEMSWELKA